MKSIKSFWNGVKSVLTAIGSVFLIAIGAVIGFLIGLSIMVFVYFLKALPYIIVIGLCLLIIVKCIV